MFIDLELPKKGWYYEIQTSLADKRHIFLMLLTIHYLIRSEKVATRDRISTIYFEL
jgi:hypothetical protein